MLVFELSGLESRMQMLSEFPVLHCNLSTMYNDICLEITSTPFAIFQFIEKSCKMQPTQRLCDAREVAQVVAWLSSELASYVNGVCLPVDGGQHNVTLGCMPPNSPLAQV